MATWITHMRICEATRGIFGFDGDLYDLYNIGNLAPDSGTLQPDGRSYYPPRKLLHRTSDDGKTIFYDDFYDEYLKYCEDSYARAFYLGYYIHLMTDDVWANTVYLPMKALYKAQIDADRGIIWRIKKQWYDLDREYLRAHVCPAFERLKAVGSVKNSYLPYIEAERLNAKLAEIIAFYADLDYTADPEYTFLTQSDIDKVIERVRRMTAEKFC